MKRRSFQVAHGALSMVQHGPASPLETSNAMLAPRPVSTSNLQVGSPPPLPLISSVRSKPAHRQSSGGQRLNKFVRRLHDMLQAEKDSGIVEWRKGLLVLFSTDIFAKKLLPKYFATKNFKTFRRQLNYYGFVHVRSFNTTGASPTALWVNRSLAQEETDDISLVLKLKRVEPCETARTVEGRRQRKELAKHTVEQDIGVNSRTLQMEQIRSLTMRGNTEGPSSEEMLRPIDHSPLDSPIPSEVHFPSVSLGASASLRNQEISQPRVIQRIDEAESAASMLLLLSKAS